MDFEKINSRLSLFLTRFAACCVMFLMLDPMLRGLSPCFAEAVIPAISMAAQSRAEMKTAVMQAGYNIIFILTDQERYFDSYPSGTQYQARERLKNIGTTFEKHYICSNMSTSSRSVIYTGKHIPDTKMFENTNLPYQPSMNPDITTVGDMMRDLGYYTAYKGKLHLMKGSNRDQQKQDALEPYGFSDWNPQGDLQGQPGEGYKEDPAVAGATISWLRAKGSSLNAAGTPFFLAVNFINPHDIMYFNTDAPEVNEQDNGRLIMPIRRAPDNELYKKTYSDPIPSTWDESYSNQVPAHEEFNKSWSRQTGKVPQKIANWERFRDFYYNNIQDNDNEVIKILDELQHLGMMGNTIIVMTSDHGELQGSHNLNGKGNNLYEYGTHVPLMIYHPDLRPASASRSALTSHLDLAPTFVSMTNADAAKKAAITKGLSGKNMLPLLNGTATSVREESLFACSLISLIDSDIRPITLSADAQLASEKRGIIRGLITAEGYKFARYFKPSGFNTPQTLEALFVDNDVEIFNLSADPDERKNLATDLRASNPNLVMQLNARLNKIVADEIGSDIGREFSEIPKRTPPDTSSDGGCSAGFARAFTLFLLGGAALLMKKR